jgi:hypothetical protein
MSRASANAAKNQLATTNTAAAGQGAQASKLESGLIPQYQSMMNEGYAPEDLSAMRTAGEGAVAGSEDAAKWEAGNRAARTGNAAGVGAEESQLARDKGVAMGNEAANIETANANQRSSNQRFALGGEQGLFGTNTSAEESLYGMAPSTINAWSNAYSNPTVPLIQSALGAGATVGAAALKH